MTLFQALTIIICGPFAVTTLAMGVGASVRDTKYGFNLTHGLILCASIAIILISFLGLK